MSAAHGIRQRAAAGVRWTMLSSIATTLAQLLQILVLSRYLAPAEFGIIGMLLIIVAFAQSYTDAGISAALVYRRDDTREQRSSLYWLNVIMGAAVALLVLVLVPAIVAVFDEPALGPYLRAIVLVLVIVPLGKQFEMLLQREMAFRRLAAQESVASVIGVAVVVVGVLLDRGVWAFVAGTVAAAVVRTIPLLVDGFRRFRPQLRFRWSDVTSYVSFGAYQLGERTVNVLSQRLDQMLIGGTLGAASLGYYNFSFNITAQPISRINPIVTRVAFPALAETRNDLSRMRKGFLDMVRILATVNAALLLGLASVAPALVPTIFGDQWIPSVPIVQVLCLVALSRSLGNPIGSLLLAGGRADLGFKWNVLVVLVVAPAVWLGGRHGGAIGVAMALLLTQVFFQLITYPLLVRPLLGHCGGEYASAVLRPLSWGAAMAVVVTVVGSLLPGTPRVAVMLAQLATGVVVYPLLLLLFEKPLVTEIRRLALKQA